ncbi:MAG: ABC transporter ATP-binding protein [Acidobacteriota bacterium]
MVPLLELENVETYYGRVLAIRGVTLEARQGQIVALLGANGAGKTTVLETTSGTVEPRKGKVRLAGEDLVGREPDEIARAGVAHVPEGREIFPFLTVEENLRVGAYTRRDDAIDEDLAAIYDLFPILAAKRRQQGGYLSGGQQQMLAIGRALMLRPRILLLDEPSLGLAPSLVADVARVIVELNRERGLTVLLVEQNARMALDIADYGYVLENGRVVMSDRAERLRHATDIREFYLGEKKTGIRGRRRWKHRKTWR